jgi:hypothetical protein
VQPAQNSKAFSSTDKRKPTPSVPSHRYDLRFFKYTSHGAQKPRSCNSNAAILRKSGKAGKGILIMKKLLKTCAIVSLSAFPALAAQNNMDASKEGKPLSTQEAELQTDIEPTGFIAEGEQIEMQENKEGEPATADGDLVDRSRLRSTFGFLP